MFTGSASLGSFPSPVPVAVVMSVSTDWRKIFLSKTYKDSNLIKGENLQPFNMFENNMDYMYKCHGYNNNVIIIYSRGL